MLALHVGRARAVDFLDFSSCMCFAAALDKNVTLDEMSVFDDRDGYWSRVEHTLRASFLEKLLSQCPQGKGLTARWMRLWRLRS